MFIINYGNGFTETVESNDLDVAKADAIAGMRYTQENVSIETVDRQLVATSHWYGVEPTEDDIVLERFGTSGFYSDWIDE